MIILLKSLAAIAVILGLAAGSVWIIGLREPSQHIYEHDTVIFVALRRDDPNADLAAQGLPQGGLWSSHALFTLIGEGDAYWTDYLILAPDTDALAGLESQEGWADMFAAQVELAQVPAFTLGLLRVQHLVGLTKRPTGPLPSENDLAEGRQDMLPTMESIEKAKGTAPDTEVTMMNFLQFKSIDRGDDADGREAYFRYGREAFRAVYTVGGQFLFAGRIKTVLVPSRDPQWNGQWDDVAAMIYPDPTAIFAMEQLPAYRKALVDRDKGLKRTRVIATEAR